MEWIFLQPASWNPTNGPDNPERRPDESSRRRHDANRSGGRRRGQGSRDCQQRGGGSRTAPAATAAQGAAIAAAAAAAATAAAATCDANISPGDRQHGPASGTERRLRCRPLPPASSLQVKGGCGGLCSSTATTAPAASESRLLRVCFLLATARYRYNKKAVTL